MTRYLPRFERSAWCLCDVDGEAEGWSLGLAWFGFHVEIAVGRRVREVPR